MGIKSFQERVAVVSCGIVEEEVRSVLNGKITFLQLFFLDPALHVYPEMLAEELKNALDRLSDSFNYFLIVYGHCHPNMDDLLASYTAKRVKASNCVEMILGKEDYRTELRKEPGTFFLTPGWCKIWRNIFINQLKVNKKLEKVFFKNFKECYSLTSALLLKNTVPRRKISQSISPYNSKKRRLILNI